MKQKIEADTTQSTMASPHKSIRFLGIPKQPDSDPNNPFDELDESDVVWSSSDLSLSPPTASNSPTSLRRHHPQNNQFHHLSGLSVALSDDLHSLVRRKPTLNPTLSAASAARTISPVALRSDGFNGAAAPGNFAKSAPVNVPIWPKNIGSFGVTNLGNFDEADEDELEEEMVPPHVIVARSHVTTFSVFEGVGRTLKGRDLCRVRNAVFQKTGFID